MPSASCWRRARRWRPSSTALADVLGRVLAADVTAGEDVPPFANSAVDGYAVRAADLAARAGRAGRRRRGGRRGRARTTACSGRGEAVRIMTGAPMPAGADAVAMVEDSERLDGGRVRLGVAVPRGVGRARRRRRRARRRGRAARRHGRHPGGARRAGQRQRPPRAGLPGRPASPCCRPATSWSPTARRCGPGQIRESNATMLAPLLAEAGCVVDRRPVVPRRRGGAGGRAARRRGHQRRHRHERRRQHGRLRRRQGGARVGSPT